MKKIVLFIIVAFLYAGCENSTTELSISNPDEGVKALSFVKTDFSKFPNLDSYIFVETGMQYSLAVKDDGTLWAWGDNSGGQLGIGVNDLGETEDQSVPTKVGTDTKWKIVSAGGTHVLAIKTDGTLWSWGSGDDGVLGHGDTNDSYVPAQVGTANNWTAVSAGMYHSLAIKSDGTLWSWGYGDTGILGHGNEDDIYTPTQVGSKTDWESISASQLNSYAIDKQGILWSWGRGNEGQLGNGGTADEWTPIQVGTGYKKVVSALLGYHALGLKTDGTLWAWGDNDYGQLGQGDTTQLHVPTQIGSATWLDVQTGNQFSVAQKSDKTLWSWGDGYQGELGLFSLDDHLSPVQISEEKSWTQLVADNEHTIALQNDGSVWTWGSGYQGELGHNTQYSGFAPQKLNGKVSWQEVKATDYVTIGIRKDGTLWSWGTGVNGDLGLGATITSQSAPAQIGTSKNWKSLSTGSNFTLALDFYGYLYSWGDNAYGQMGNGDAGLNDLNIPTKIGTATWKSFCAGIQHGVGIQTNGTLWSWGRNRVGQTGLGTTSGNTLSPTQIGTDTDWDHVYCSAETTFAFKSNGDEWAFGEGRNGQRADNNASIVTTPMALTLENFEKISGGINHGTGHKSDGTLWSWGSYVGGRLGVEGLSSNQLLPIQVGSDTTWIESSAAGNGYGIGIKSDGTLWSWGNNSNGNLGLGDRETRYLPTQVGSDTDWLHVDAGDYHVVAIKKDGSFYAFGYGVKLALGNESMDSSYVPISPESIEESSNGSSTLSLDSLGALWGSGKNTYGQLGVGDLSTHDSAVKIESDLSWSSFSMGETHAAGIKSDGTLWAWGSNVSGQLGIENTERKELIPLQVGTDSDWTMVSCANKHTVALKSDGTVWAWGDNSYGQLGLENLNLNPIVALPTKVGSLSTWTKVFAYENSTFAEQSDGTVWAAGELTHFEVLK